MPKGRTVRLRCLVVALATIVVPAAVTPQIADARPSRAARSQVRRVKVRKAKMAKAPAAPRQASGAVGCARYRRGGSVLPQCAGRTAGTIRNVVVETVPGTNIVVNKAWTPYVAAFVGAARQAGFDLQAWDFAGHGQGSFRTAAMQRDLRRRGFPANPVGTSMHEWGLAVDFSCNGAKFLDAPAACRDWVRGNAAAFGIYNLASEPWHWSSNGR